MATIPPMVHSISSEKPEVMSLTWNPRLVKTPMPTMSATTIAVAVTPDTLATVLPPEIGSVIKWLSILCTTALHRAAAGAQRHSGSGGGASLDHGADRVDAARPIARYKA